jgi:hypothetical protein
MHVTVTPSMNWYLPSGPVQDADSRRASQEAMGRRPLVLIGALVFPGFVPTLALPPAAVMTHLAAPAESESEGVAVSRVVLGMRRHVDFASRRDARFAAEPVLAASANPLAVVWPWQLQVARSASNTATPVGLSGAEVAVPVPVAGAAVLIESFGNALPKPTPADGGPTSSDADAEAGADQEEGIPLRIEFLVREVTPSEAATNAFDPLHAVPFDAPQPDFHALLEPLPTSGAHPSDAHTLSSSSSEPRVWVAHRMTVRYIDDVAPRAASTREKAASSQARAAEAARLRHQQATEAAQAAEDAQTAREAEAEAAAEARVQSVEEMFERQQRRK